VRAPVSIKWTRTKFHISTEELAEHLGMQEYDLLRYERGNLTIPPSVSRLLTFLATWWEENGYQEPERFWGSAWE
jgi:transcriptional regulator with XRE-family HTH domain